MRFGGIPQIIKSLILEEKEVNECQNQICETCDFVQVRPEAQRESVPDPIDYKCTVKGFLYVAENCPKWKLKGTQKQ